MIVVGLSGYKGAGKDTVADILVRDYGFTKMSFAAPLKAMLRRLDPIIGHDLYAGCCAECSDQPEVTEVRMSDAAKFGFDDQSLKHSPWAEEVRGLWERLGTECIREEDEDFWVSLAELQIEASTAERIVFTDVRFENEVEMIYAQESENIHTSVWRIARQGTAAGDHDAEKLAGLLGEEVTILNDGTIDELREPVAMAMSLMLYQQIPGQMEFDLND